MVQLLTVKQLAQREQVSERTVRRWIEKRAVEIHRNPGGSIRIVERRAVILTLRDQDEPTRPAA